MTKSHTVAILPLLVALNKFTKINASKFVGYTDDQKYILELLSTLDSIKYVEDDIPNFVSKDVNEINKLLKEKGFTIQLPDLPGTAVATICKLNGTWYDEGRDDTVVYNKTTYKAFKLREGVSGFTKGEKEILVLKALNFSNFKVSRDNREMMELKVFIEPTDIERSGLELFKHIYATHRELSSYEKTYYRHAIIPVASIKNEPDLKWLTGITPENFNAKKGSALTHIIQQNYLELHKKGISIESGTAGMQALGSANGEIVIDTPFNIWVTYGTPYSFPIFTAYVAPDSWKIE